MKWKSALPSFLLRIACPSNYIWPRHISLNVVPNSDPYNIFKWAQKIHFSFILEQTTVSSVATLPVTGQQNAVFLRKFQESVGWHTLKPKQLTLNTFSPPADPWLDLLGFIDLLKVKKGPELWSHEECGSAKEEMRYWKTGRVFHQKKKNVLQSFILIIHYSRQVMPPSEPDQLQSRQYGKVDHFLGVTPQPQSRQDWDIYHVLEPKGNERTPGLNIVLWKT